VYVSEKKKTEGKRQDSKLEEQPSVSLADMLCTAAVMLRHNPVSLRCLRVAPTFVWRITSGVRWMSTRQAERLRGRATPTQNRPTASTCGASPSPKAHDCSKLKRGHPAKRSSFSSSSSFPVAELSASPGATTSRVSAAAPKPQMRGRFNRLVIEHGLFFSLYLYVLGESITLAFTYLLHTRRLGVGDTGSWLAAVGFPVERYLNVGPTVYGLQLSPRLLLNYLVVNACMYPLLKFEMRFCLATAPALRAPFRWLRRAVMKTEPAIPKAPSATP
jgi:hypothetical protein